MRFEVRALLSRQAPQLRVVEREGYPGPEELARLLAKPPELCFLDIETEPERALALLKENATLSERVSVIALLGRNDPTLILRSMRMGAAGFLVRPFTDEQLHEALERVRQLLAGRQPAPRRTGRVWCVLPAKGASGATTVAINLAYQAARNGAEKVLLADLDPLASPVSFLLKIKNRYSFLDALTKLAQLDDDLWRALVVPCQGVDVLLAPEDPPETATESHDAGAILEHARARYDVVVADAGTAFGKWSLGLASRADELLLVAAGEPAALFGARRVVTSLQQAGVSAAQVRLILNRQKRTAGLEPEEVARAVGVPVYHVIPEDAPALAKAQMNGRPVSSDTALARSLTELAVRLMGRNAPRAGKVSAWRAWFGRRSAG
ncbi:MAG: AAA family ATPase [Bryobacterales bacterium]|nr:AAA family ATPase [Bryobacterales bacterium]